jgi:c-di-GMP-binding flagellar brake protein YcgR
MPEFEHRKYKRTSAKFMLSYKVSKSLQVAIMASESKIDAIMGNISQGGLMMVTQYDLPIDSKLTLSFAVVNDAALHDDDKIKALDIEGVVRSKRQIKHNEFDIGVEFVDPSQEDQKFLAEFVDET